MCLQVSRMGINCCQTYCQSQFVRVFIDEVVRSGNQKVGKTWERGLCCLQRLTDIMTKTRKLTNIY